MFKIAQTFKILSFFFLAFFLVSEAIADPSYVTATLSIAQDGTAAFDADDTIGNDSSANNARIRLNDSVTYNVDITLNGFDQTNVRFIIVAPTGMYWITLPQQCLTNNALDTTPNPISSISADGRTLLCNLGDLSQGTTNRVQPIAKVRGNVLEGTILPVSLTAEADNTTQVAVAPVQVTATARPKIDLRKVVTSSDRPIEENGPMGERGRIITYNIGLVMEKGSEQMANISGLASFALQDILTNSNVNGINTYHLYTWGPNGADDACGPVGLNGYGTELFFGGFGYGRIGITSNATAQNSVIDSGSISCNQGGSGAPININVTNANVTAETAPTLYSSGFAIAGSDAFIFSMFLNIWIAEDDILSNSLPSGTGTTLSTTNTISGAGGAAFDPDGISGNSNYGAGTEPTGPGPNSNSANASLGLTPTGFSSRNTLIGYEGTDGGLKSCESKVLQNSNDYFVSEINIGAGAFTFDVGNNASLRLCQKLATNNAVFTSDSYDTFLYYRGSNPLDYYYQRLINDGPLNGGINPNIVRQKSWAIWNQLTCPINFTDLATFSYSGSVNGCSSELLNKLSPFGSQEPGSEGYNYLSTLNNLVGTRISSPDLYETNPAIQDPVCEYSITPLVDARTDTCNDADGPWTTIPAAQFPPINLPIGARVRCTYTFPRTVANIPGGFITGRFFTETSWPFHVLPTAPIGSYVGIFQSYTIDGGASWIHAPVTISSDPLNPSYACDLTNTRNFADRVQIVSARARIVKTTNPLKAITNPNEETRFEITPSLESVLSTPTSVTLIDTLPTQMDFVVGSTEVVGGTPSHIVSAPIISGDTVTWTISNVNAGEPLPTIYYRALVNGSIGVANLTLTNSVEIQTPVDTTSTVQERTAFSALRLVSRGSFAVYKEVVESLIEAEDNLSFDLVYSNLSGTNFSAGEFIDVFSYNGDVSNTFRSPTSSFTGNLNLLSINGTNGETFEYTKAPVSSIVLDPCDITNITLGATSTAFCPVLRGGGVGTGTTVWCATLSGGSCPASLSEVTGIRFRTTAFNAYQPERRIRLTYNTNGNVANDQYVNNFAGQIPNIPLLVRSNDILASVISGSIGDRVWWDLDGDGIQDSNEAGIVGVILNLSGTSYGSDGTPGGGDDLPININTTTGADGIYIFSGLHSGSYTITVAQPFGTQQTYDLDGLGTPNDSGNISLSAGNNISVADFGYRGSTNAQISGYVLEDINRDMTQVGGDTPLAGITLGLYDSSGNLVATTTTDINGFYSFGFLPAGNYTIREIQPSGFEDSYVIPGSSGGNAGVNEITNISLIAGGNSQNNNFGELRNIAAIGDQVFYDADGDGIRDSSEWGISGVQVQLLDSMLSIVQNNVTDGSGYYKFINLPSGIYTVRFILPSGFNFTANNQGDDDVFDSDANSSGYTQSISLISGEENLTLDAGLTNSQILGSLAGRVFFDSNNSNTDNSEPAVTGARIDLIDAGSLLVISTNHTDAYGNYEFSGLPPGNYIIQVSGGYNFVVKDIGSDNAIDSDVNQITGQSDTISLGAGEHITEIDAGINNSNLITLGDFVWLDANSNGIQDPNETGVAGVRVLLIDSTNTILMTVTTDSSGNYQFANIFPGSYKVLFVPSALGLSATNANIGSDLLDSDIDAYFTIPLANYNSSNESLDAGLTGTVGSIGDYVWLDLDQDGIQGAEEIPLSGYTVCIHRADGLRITCSTSNSQGNYQFNNLPAGDYYVEIAIGIADSFTSQGIGTATDSDAKINTGRTGIFSLPVGGINVDLDFGILSSCVPATINQLQIDGSAHALRVNVSNAVKLRKFSAKTRICPRLSSSRQVSVLTTAQNYYQSAWTTIWSEYYANGLSCANSSSPPLSCNVITNNKQSLINAGEGLRNLAQNLFKKCKRNSRISKFKSSTRTKHSSYDSLINSIPSNFAVCN